MSDNIFKAFFFDVDETLIDAHDCHIRANEIAYRHFGYDFYKVWEKSNNRYMFGLTLRDILRINNQNAGITEKEIPLEELYQVRLNAFVREVKKKAVLLPGANEALKQCKDSGAKVILVSSGARKFILALIKKFGWSRYIDSFICEDDVKKGKPDPECYLMAYSKLEGIPKKDVLVIEDSEAGVNAAQAGGFKVLLVPYHGREIRDIFAEYRLGSLEKFNINSL